MKKLFLFATLLCASLSAFAAVQGKEVTYSANGTTLKGYVAWDDAVKGSRPGMLVVHEWWGHNEYARKRARMLAELGYTALALDMYGDGKQAHHPDDAGKFAGEVAQNSELARARFNAALDLLKRENSVDASRIGAIGYCFGGTVVMEMARVGAPLKAVASFHGMLSSKEAVPSGQVEARIRAYIGADDPFISAAQMQTAREVLEKSGADYQVTMYPGVKHSFTNPDADKYGKQFNLPLAYDAEADKASWEAMKAFLTETFAKK